MKIGKISIDKINPYKNNAKLHPPEQIEQIKRSIKEFGNNDPIAIDENNVIIEGHGRYQALKELGFNEVEVIRLTHLNEQQKKAYILAHNKLTMNTGFDFDTLNLELDTIVDFDMSDFGFEKLDFQGENDQELIEDKTPEIPEEPKAELGDIYQLGNHRLMCGDSTKCQDIEKLMSGARVDMVFTDPPYGMNLDTDYSDMKSKISKGGNRYDRRIIDNFDPKMIEVILSLEAEEVFLWGADYFAELLPKRNSGSWIVWDKRTNPTDDIEKDYSSDRMYGSCFELCWSKKKHKRDIARVKWAGMFGIEKQDQKKRLHPTQKPLELCGWFLKKYSKENNIILDLFGGSGSTLIDCEQLNRKCYMMELDPKYVDVIIDRWEKFTGRKAVKIDG